MTGGLDAKQILTIGRGRAGLQRRVPVRPAGRGRRGGSRRVVGRVARGCRVLAEAVGTFGLVFVAPWRPGAGPGRGL